MPYQNWYSAATNAAVDMNMPPALVPPLASAVAPARQPITPINANVPSADVTTEDENSSTIQSRIDSFDTSNYARNLRTAGRFDRETAMVTPMETQRMMFGDQAFRNTRRITEERNDDRYQERLKYWKRTAADKIVRSQEAMRAESNDTGEDYNFENYGYVDLNTSNPFSNRYSSLWS